MATTGSVPLTPPQAAGRFEGWQRRRRGVPLALFTPSHSVGIHTAGSTLCGGTILRAGWAPPGIPCVTCGAAAAWVTYRWVDDELDADAWCEGHGQAVDRVSLAVAMECDG
jgi:hypothetical protein